MKPQGHLSFPKEVGKAFAEAKLSALDRPGAAAALGATACGGFKEVSHPGRIFQGGVGLRAASGISSPRSSLNSLGDQPSRMRFRCGELLREIASAQTQ